MYRAMKLIQMVVSWAASRHRITNLSSCFRGTC